MNTTGVPAVEAHLADHDGIITTEQAYALGLSERQVRRLAATGCWQRLARGVYLSAQHHFTDRARLRAAVAAHHGVADRTAAAFWHGLLDDLPPRVTLSAPRSTRGSAQGPLAVSVRRRTFPDEDVEMLGGLAVTRRPLTVLAAAGELDDGAALIDRSLQTGAVSVEALCRSLDRNTGKHGLAVARELVRVLTVGSQSEAERRWVDLLTLHRIDGWVQQYPFGHWTLDFAWPALKVAVEIQGWAYHRDARRFQADTAKAAALAAAGWLELPFTWHHLTGDPERCVAQLCSALNQRIA